jgi:hypothetical protein
MAKPTIRRYKRPSSPERRQAARDRIAAIKAREEAIIARQKELRGWNERLTRAARFVVDVNGDPPSIPELATTVADAEESLELSQERRELIDERRKTQGASWYHQFDAIDDSGFIGVVVATADSLRELKGKIQKLKAR